MARLIYSTFASLDGYVTDEAGRFDWAEPDEEVHRFANDLERPIGTYLYGRRMYEVMTFWETLDPQSAPPEYIADYARVWQAADKIVYSTTLRTPSTRRTRVEARFDPEAVRVMKSELQRDISIGGPTLAAAAIEAGLVDEYGLLIVPVSVGGGLRALPAHLRVDLTLLDERRFANGTVYLRYAASAG